MCSKETSVAFPQCGICCFHRYKFNKTHAHASNYRTMKIHPFLLSLSMMLLFFATGCQKQEDFTSADFAQETPLLLNDGDVNVSSFDECCSLCEVKVRLFSTNLNNSVTIRRGEGCATYTVNTNGDPTVATGHISGSSNGNIKIKNNGFPVFNNDGTITLHGKVYGEIKLCGGASVFIPFSNAILPGEERELPLAYNNCLIPEPPGPEPDDKQ